FCQITLDKCGLYRLVTESMENSTWDYDNAIRNYKEKSLYDTGVTAEHGVRITRKKFLQKTFDQLGGSFFVFMSFLIYKE
ncbi:MAG: hypothetical protein ACI4LQ_01725, partial [Anaerovoracaceae bacterium]